MLVDTSQQIKLQCQQIAQSNNRPMIEKIMKEIKESLRSMLELIRTAENKKKLSSFYNRFSSYYDGFRDNEFSLQEAHAFIGKVHNAMGVMRPALAEEDKKRSRKVDPRIAQLMEDYGFSKSDAEYYLRQEDADEKKAGRSQPRDSGFNYDDFLNKLGDTVNMTNHKYSREAQMLTQLASKNYIFARVPVIPLTQGIIDFQKVSKVFDIERVGSYIALENQLVLGLNRDFIDAYGTKVKLTKKQQIKRDPVTNHSVLNAKKATLAWNLASLIIGKYQEKSGKRIHTVGGIAGHSTGLYFWLMSEQEFNAFNATAAGGRSKVITWGFAFQGKEDRFLAEQRRKIPQFKSANDKKLEEQQDKIPKFQ